MKKSDLRTGMSVKLRGYSELAIVHEATFTYNNTNDTYIHLDRYREDLSLISSCKEYTIEAVYAKPMWEAPRKISVGNIVVIHEIKSLSPSYNGKMQRKFPVGSEHMVVRVDGDRGVMLVGADGFLFEIDEVRIVYA